MLERAYSLGLTREDVIVDGLVSTVGANRKAALETLETIRYCREKGLATICGLSNISFGMPERSFVNTAFLTLAIREGLTMAIANPSQELLVGCALATDLLLAKEEADIRFIEYTGIAAEKREKKEAELRKKLSETAVRVDPSAGKGTNDSAGRSATGVRAGQPGNMPGGGNTEQQGTGSGDSGAVRQQGVSSGDSGAVRQQGVSSGDSDAVRQQGVSSGDSDARQQPRTGSRNGEGKAGTENKNAGEEESRCRAVLRGSVLKGNRNGIAAQTREALRQGEEPSALLNEILLPAINQVGELFDKGKYFLPQLIASAEAMKNSIEVLEPLLQQNTDTSDMPAVVIATVEGDIHDIGKNLVALMLKN